MVSMYKTPSTAGLFLLLMAFPLVGSPNERMPDGVIGVIIQKVPEGVMAQRVMEGLPAWVAGIKEGDVITHVNGRSIAAFDVQTVQKMIGGPQGTSVAIRTQAGGDRVYQVRRTSRIWFTLIKP